MKIILHIFCVLSILMISSSLAGQKTMVPQQDGTEKLNAYQSFQELAQSGFKPQFDEVQLPTTKHPRPALEKVDDMVTVFTDRTEFLSDCPDLPTEDFEGAPVAPGGVIACGTVISSTTANCYPEGELLPGFAFSSALSGTLVALGSGTVGPTTAIAPDLFADNGIFTFSVPTTAAGFDLLGFGSSTTLSVSGSNGILWTGSVSIGSFIGFKVNGDIITSIVVVDPQNTATEVFDNLTFGTCNSNSAPTAVCKAVTVDADANCQGTADAEDFDGGSTDPDEDELIFSVNTTGPYALGTTAVTLTVSDGQASSTCNTTITVEDNTAPTALCQNLTVQLNANGMASITTVDVDGGSSDNCGIASLSVSPNTFDCEDVGANTVTLTVTDNNGNPANCTATATLQDNVAPVALCQNITVQLDVNGDGALAATAVNNGSSDACGIASLSVSPNTFDCEDVGTNTVTLTVTDNNGNPANCTATATLQDNVAPVALCQNITVQLDVNGDGALAATAVNNGSSDACGIASLSVSPNTFDCEDVGTNTVTLTVTDNNGNPANCTATATVEDNVAPMITLCEGTSVVFNGEEEFLASTGIDFSATDACGLASTTYSPAVLTCEQLGLNVPVVVTVTDNNGQASTCTASVKVDGLPCGFMDFDEDGIGCEDSNEVNYDASTQSFTLESDGCSSVNFAQDDAAYVKAEMCGNGEIIAHITSINPLGQGWAGITMRESEAPGAKKVELLVNLSNFIRRAVRTTTNGYAIPAQFFRPGATWLKLVRTGNQFVGYASPNGVTWQIVLVANVPMNACIQAGLMVTNYNGNAIVTGTFDNVSVTGSGNMNLQIPNTNQQLPEATQSQDFSFFPNPATSEIHVDLSAFAGQEAVVRIYNQVGQVLVQSRVEEAGFQPEKLDLNQLPLGTYFLEVISEEYRQVKKLLKTGL